ncbi:hypothetical protein K8I61_01725 [bacterium]|nr:hypothetical protein [bacterium]
MTLFAGAAQADITPHDLSRAYLAGFGQNRRATHVLDPLQVRVLYLRKGNEEIAIASVDLIGLLEPDARRIREAVLDIPAARILLASTHTHSAPDTLGLWGPTAIPGVPMRSGVDPAYMAAVRRETARTIRRAKRRARPAIARLAVDGSDKREHTWNVRNRDLMDDEMVVLRLDRADGGGTIGVLTNFASHPEALWDKNTGISSDFVAPMHKVIERRVGGLSVFVNGALGGMVTPGIEMDVPLEPRLALYREYGETLGELSARAAERAAPIEGPQMTMREDIFDLPVGSEYLRFLAHYGLFDREVGETVRTTISVLQFGPLRLLAAPGEVLPTLGIAWKRLAGGPAMLIGPCNDELGYLVPDEFFEDPAYRYEQNVGPGRGAAEFLTNRYEALIRTLPPLDEATYAV